MGSGWDGNSHSASRTQTTTWLSYTTQERHKNQANRYVCIITYPHIQILTYVSECCHYCAMALVEPLLQGIQIFIIDWCIYYKYLNILPASDACIHSLVVWPMYARTGKVGGVETKVRLLMQTDECLWRGVARYVQICLCKRTPHTYKYLQV